MAPMAVMVTPSKVDYSVTKGGLRLWAVLLVFVVLCSSLYTLFSAKEMAELALGKHFLITVLSVSKTAPRIRRLETALCCS